MKRFLASLALLWLALLPAISWAFTYHYVNNAVVVTNISQSVPATGFFTNNHSGGGGESFWATEVTVRNTGANELFVDCDDRVATTSDTVVASGELMKCTYPNASYAHVGIVGSTGETTTAAVDAVQ